MRSTYMLTGEITAETARQFFWLAGEDAVDDVVICSPGGDVGCAFGMFDVIKFNGIKTHIVGMAQSAAAVLSQAGSWRTMTNSSLLLFHSPPEGSPDQAWRCHTQLAEMVAQRTGLSYPEALGLFDDKFIDANRALELNLIDEIAEDAEWYRWVKNGKVNKAPEQQPTGRGEGISPADPDPAPAQ